MNEANTSNDSLAIALGLTPMATYGSVSVPHNVIVNPNMSGTVSPPIPNAQSVTVTNSFVFDPNTMLLPLSDDDPDNDERLPNARLPAPSV